MSDLPKYLPLSQRPRRDESAVSSDWSERVAAVLTSLAVFVEGLTPERRELAHDDLARLVWRLRATRQQRLVAKFRRRAPLALTTNLPRALREVAAEPRKRAIGDLASAVVTALDVAREAHGSIDIDPVSLGAVAVARALNAPLPIRAVLSSVTLVAIDGDWAVGRDAQRNARGADIVLFLYGRTGLPPVYDGEMEQNHG